MSIGVYQSNSYLIVTVHHGEVACQVYNRFTYILSLNFVDEWSHDKWDEIRSRIKTSRWQEISVQVKLSQMFFQGYQISRLLVQFAIFPVFHLISFIFLDDLG